MLNALAWLFLTKLNDPINALRLSEEAKELTVSLEAKDLRQNDFIVAANFVLIAILGAQKEVDYDKIRDVAANNQTLLEERFQSIQTGTATIDHEDTDPTILINLSSELLASDSEAEEVEILEKQGQTK